MRFVATCLVAFSVAGCPIAEPPLTTIDTPRPVPTTTLAPITIRAYSSVELLAELESARAQLLIEDYNAAAPAFDRVLELAVEPAIKAIAAYDAGMAYDALGDRERAIARFQSVDARWPEQPIARNALVRLSRIFGRLERWDELEHAADRLLARADLPLMDKIEGHGAKALSLVERGRKDDARLHVGKAAEIIETQGFGRSGTPPPQLAQVSFAEGEIRRLESEEYKLVPVPPNFSEVLELRCERLLEAQSAFTEAMRSRDSHWSAMSGYRVGQLYQVLHSETMQIPAPAAAKTLKQKQLFEAAIRLRYRILLEKGLKMMDGTARIGDRTGEQSEWIRRAREAKRSLEQSLADEKTALAAMPFTEDEVKAALEDLKRRPKKP
ncbi:MAG: hypothetical protein EXR75_05670 [Myxococcales bacterium]|nr:hypothetical protein [Myxococcales bacterium]